ncbi:MAG: hypothetical protein K2M31_01345 [Muribaculaceae bacterium]|nr:hypothetical protein [Muribaculaceae bacterium]
MELRLDICIIAYRREGLERILSLNHPRIEGVRYIVAWQYADANPEDIPEGLADREDFLIIPNSSHGGGANRMIALEAAEAPIVLLSDDDISYEVGDIERLLNQYYVNPQIDYILMKCRSYSAQRDYPDYSFDAANPPKGYFCGGPEISFRLGAVKFAGISFNPLFGRGSQFCAGEDSLFVFEMQRHGLRGLYIPEFVCSHEDNSTGLREITTDAFVRAKGAMFTYFHPRTWPLRMIIHAFRLNRSAASFIRYQSNWLRGVRDLRYLLRNERIRKEIVTRKAP